MQGTHSTGASLLLWLAGSIYCLAGVHVYIEYGLNAPRYIFQGIEQSVPRSGGDLNYLQYVYRRPGYRNDTVLLSTCLFGVVFICLGNMAGNSISFATRILGAAGNDNPSNGTVRGIALAAAVVTCFIHTISRRGGIFLNNVLAIVKIMILLLIVVVAIVVAAGGLDTTNVISTNTKPSKAFDNALSDANGYAQAFLAIIFAFSGFEQPNYVMGEISHPRRKHPISTIVGVSTVIVLYMAVNISYVSLKPSTLSQGEAANSSIDGGC
jgi:amino acid transporter